MSVIILTIKIALLAVVSFLFIAILFEVAQKLLTYVRKRRQPIRQKAVFSEKKYGRPFDRKLLIILGSVATVSRLFLYVLGLLFDWLYFRSLTSVQDYWGQYWVRWDAISYVRLASEWYSTSFQPESIAFYPGFPFLIRMLSLGGLLHTTLIALVTNVLLFSLAAVLIYVLVARDHGKTVAKRAYVLLLLTPAGFFFAAPFTESLFLFLTALFFFLLYNRYFWMAGISGMLAALTKSQGMLLVVPAGIGVLREVAVIARTKNGSKGKHDLAVLGGSLLVACMVAFGFTLFLFHNYLLFGNPLMFLFYVEHHWMNGPGFFLTNLLVFVEYLVHDTLIRLVGVWLPVLLLFPFTLWLILMGLRRRVRLEYVAYLFVFLLFSYTPSFLVSGFRYMAVAVPIYIILGVITDTKAKFGTATAISGILLISYLFFFFKGWVL